MQTIKEAWMIQTSFSFHAFQSIGRSRVQRFSYPRDHPPYEWTVMQRTPYFGQSPYLQGLGKLMQRPVKTCPPGRLGLALSTVIWTTALTAFASGLIRLQAPR